MFYQTNKMKKVIELLRSRGFEVLDNGTIISNLPDGLEGIALVDEIEEVETEDGEIYTIINNKIEKI